jgi:hypothetical protein
MIRPDVIFALNPAGDGGGQHHQASAILSNEAFKLAGDPTKYPEHIKEGLRAWQPKKFYFPAGGGPGAAASGARVTRINLAVYDALLGKTYAEIGTEARSMHKCQGTGQLLSLPGPAVATYQLADATIAGQKERDEQSLFDGIDHSIRGLAQFAGSAAPQDLIDGLTSIAASVDAARQRFDAGDEGATLQPLLGGLRQVRALRARLGAMPIDDTARYEIDFRLNQKEREFQQAAIFANGIRIEPLADDGIVIPGQPIKVSLLVANRGASGVAVRNVTFTGFDGEAACALTAVTAGGQGRGGRGGRGGPAPAAQAVSTLATDQTARCEPTLKIPGTARPSDLYWRRRPDEGRYSFDADAPFGLPFRPTPFRVQVTMSLSSGAEAPEDVVSDRPVQFRYEDVFSGEKRSELLIVPAVSVKMSPEIAIFPAGSSDRARELRVTVTNDSLGPADNAVTLTLPAGWTSSPAEQGVKLGRSGEAQTVRFLVTPPPKAPLGEVRVRAVATSGAQTFSRGYQVIEYPHTRRRHIAHEAETTLKIIDVATAPNLTVGYIMGVGDQVPPSIAQLGARVEMIDTDMLAWGNLSRFDTIVTGVRAYERREDLRAHNRRLIEYVENGGTLIVQYNKFEFNETDYGPYPARVSNNRVTDENAPVQPLVPDDPVFQRPNRIGQEVWRGWVQERGLYFLGEKDPRYVDLVQLEDPFAGNSGAKRGALVQARVGKGRWLYVGLGLWRQLPAGTDGAYRLLANLISLGRSP